MNFGTDKLRVLHVLLGTKIWGVERYVLNLQHALRPLGVECIAICCDAQVAAEFEKHGCESHLVPIRGYLDLMASQKIFQAIKQLNIDIVHTHLGIDSFIGTTAAKSAGVSAVISVHFDRPAYESLQPVLRESWKMIQRLKNMNVDHFLPITENVAAELAQREGVPREKMTVVAPGSPLIPAVSAGQKVSLRKQLAVPDGKTLVLAIGRLSPEKGMDVLICAFAKLRQTQPDALLWILGDGSEQAHLAGLISTLYLNETVKLLGYRPCPDARELLHACDFFALASRAEPFGLAAVEAMMCERAAIGTAGTGLATIIVDNNTGLLVPPDDVDALAAAMTKLAQDSSLRDAFGTAGRERAIKLFTDETMAKLTASVYRRVARHESMSLNIPRQTGH